MVPWSMVSVSFRFNPFVQGVRLPGRGHSWSARACPNKIKMFLGYRMDQDVMHALLLPMTLTDCFWFHLLSLYSFVFFRSHLVRVKESEPGTWTLNWTGWVVCCASHDFLQSPCGSGLRSTSGLGCAGVAFAGWRYYLFSLRGRVSRQSIFERLWSMLDDFGRS